MTDLPDWADHVTVLRAHGLRLVKLIPPEGEAISYDSAKHFHASIAAVHGLESLRTLLDELQGKTDTCIVRGELIGVPPVARMRRLVYADNETGDAPTLRDVPRRWLALDHDSVPMPEDCLPKDLLACADAVIDLLPRQFWRALLHRPGDGAAWHQTRHPPSHLALVRQGPLGGAEVKRWLGKLTDSSVLKRLPAYLYGPPCVLRRRV